MQRMNKCEFMCEQILVDRFLDQLFRDGCVTENTNKIKLCTHFVPIFLFHIVSDAEPICDNWAKSAPYPCFEKQKSFGTIFKGKLYILFSFGCI